MDQGERAKVGMFECVKCVLGKKPNGVEDEYIFVITKLYDAAEEFDSQGERAGA